MKIAWIICIFLSFSCFSQDKAYNYFSFRGNTNFQLPLEFKEKGDSVKPHSILTAVLLSTGVPGAGQIYNHTAMPKGKKKAFWKVPLIYAGLGATAYFLVSNHNEVTWLREEYRLRLGLEGGKSHDRYDAYDNTGLLTLHGQYQTRRDLSVLGMSLIYLIQIADAGVEAHFVNFDISKDLSLAIEPTMVNYDTAGLRLSLNFR